MSVEFECRRSSSFDVHLWHPVVGDTGTLRLCPVSLMRQWTAEKIAVLLFHTEEDCFKKQKLVLLHHAIRDDSFKITASLCRTTGVLVTMFSGGPVSCDLVGHGMEMRNNNRGKRDQSQYNSRTIISKWTEKNNRIPKVEHDVCSLVC